VGVAQISATMLRASKVNETVACAKDLSVSDGSLRPRVGMIEWLRLME
jgi:hypothetical protein